VHQGGFITSIYRDARTAKHEFQNVILESQREVAYSFVWNYQFLTSAVIRASWPILANINRKSVEWLCYGPEDWTIGGSIPGTCKSFFTFPKFAKWFRGLNSALSHMCTVFFPMVKSARCLLKIPGLLNHYICSADTKVYTYSSN
jgi:hypothetical protein